MSKSNQVSRPLAVSGLDDVMFAETNLSHVDGEKGQLIIGGHDVEDLGGKLSFEDLSSQLLQVNGLTNFKSQLGQFRVEAFAALQRWAGQVLMPENGMDFLRLALASVDSRLPQPGTHATNELHVSESLRLIAMTAVAAAYWNRRRLGLDVIAPDATSDHAADYLHMATGKTPDLRLTAALNTYLVTVSDHGMNASTFAARVVASTGSDLSSAVVAGVGALKGPLHGGAPGPVLDMLAAIGEPQQAAAWLEAELVAGRRIMGMGHRIYRVRDPRAAVLEQALERLEAAGVQSSRLQLARAVERAAGDILAARYPDRPLKANVEFYTAVLLDVIGLPVELFSPTFGVGRVLGWCAHVAEQRLYGRLVRPQSKYVEHRRC